MSRLLLCALLGLLMREILAAVTTVDIRTPDFQDADQDKEIYVCTAVRMPDKPMKLVAIEPLASQEIVHHILLFGCNAPTQVPTVDQPDASWNCFTHSVCKDASTILYGWAKDAPELQYPDQVGLSLGPGTGITYIVGQVHYLKGLPKGDHSGVRLSLSDGATPYAAGLISFASYFSVPANTPQTLVPNECCYQGFQPLRTFAFRVHTHALGRRVWMERELTNESGADGKHPIEVIAERSPQLPQGFIPIDHTVIFPGERLKVTCDFNSTGVNHVVTAGPTHEYEMCNLYMMLYSELPYLASCDGGAIRQNGLEPNTPGGMDKAAKFTPDLLFNPPHPDSLTPNGGPTGDVTSVTMAPNGTVWVLTRGSRHWDEATFTGDHRMTTKEPIKEECVMQLDADTGKRLRSWGAKTFAMPHMITVDQWGDVWVVDTGLHQVLKFTPEGKLLLSIGKAGEPGSGPDHLCQPTQVAVLNSGELIVSDGYCNSRAVLYSAAGEYKAEFALAGMQVVHSVLADECAGKVYLADRESRKVQQFELGSRKHVQTLEMPMKVWALRNGPYGLPLALLWEDGKEAELRVLNAAPAASWQLPGLLDQRPHDFALGGAPTAYSGPGQRMLSAYVAPLCVGCLPLQKLVLAPAGVKLEEALVAWKASVAAGATTADAAAATGIGKEAVTALAAGAAAGAARSSTLQEQAKSTAAIVDDEEPFDDEYSEDEEKLTTAGTAVASDGKASTAQPTELKAGEGKASTAKPADAKAGNTGDGPAPTADGKPAKSGEDIEKALAAEEEREEELELEELEQEIEEEELEAKEMEEEEADNGVAAGEEKDAGAAEAAEGAGKGAGTAASAVATKDAELRRGDAEEAAVGDKVAGAAAAAVGGDKGTDAAAAGKDDKDALPGEDDPEALEAEAEEIEHEEEEAGEFDTATLPATPATGVADKGAAKGDVEASSTDTETVKKDADETTAGTEEAQGDEEGEEEYEGEEEDYYGDYEGEEMDGMDMDGADKGMDMGKGKAADGGDVGEEEMQQAFKEAAELASQAAADEEQDLGWGTVAGAWHLILLGLLLASGLVGGTWYMLRSVRNYDQLPDVEREPLTRERDSEPAVQIPGQQVHGRKGNGMLEGKKGATIDRKYKD